MPWVVASLDNEGIELPQPREPAYFARRHYETGEAGGESCVIDMTRNTGGALEVIMYFLRRFQRFVQPYRTETDTAFEPLSYKGNASPFSSSRE
jgi:hypothetical protein